MIISKAHRMNFRDLNEDEIIDLSCLKKKIISSFEDHLGINVSIIMNNGKPMDQGLHFHVHVIPRYPDDQLWSHVSVTTHTLNKEYLKKLLNQRE